LDTSRETTTVLVVSTVVTFINVIVVGKMDILVLSGLEASTSNPGETIDESDAVPVGIAMGEAVEVLNKRQVAYTTTTGRSNNLTSTNAGLKEVILVDAVISIGAKAPVRPLRKDAINGIEVRLSNDGHLSGFRRLVDIFKLASIMEESEVTATEETIWSIHESRSVARTGNVANHLTPQKLANVADTIRGELLGITLRDDTIAEKAVSVSSVRRQPPENLDVINNLRASNRSEEFSLVLVEAVLIGVRNIGNKVGIKVGGVTIVVKATTTILLGRFATVRPIIVKIAAKLRLAGTVGTVRGVKARVEPVNRGIAVIVSKELAVLIDGQASRSRSRGMTAVGIVSTKGSFKESAVNALVLTARYISLESTSGATSAKLSLATVQRGVIAISKAGEASEEATTTSGRSPVTVAKNGTSLENIGEVDVSRAVNSLSDDSDVGLSQLTTVLPESIVVAAKRLVASVGRDVALRNGANSLASRRARGQTRESSTINAVTITTASVGVEDALGGLSGWAPASINLATVGCRAIAIEVVVSALVVASTVIAIATNRKNALINSEVNSSVEAESKARDRLIGRILKSSVARARSQRAAAERGGNLATVPGVTVAIDVASSAINLAGTSNLRLRGSSDNRASSRGNVVVRISSKSSAVSSTEASIDKRVSIGN